MDKRDYWLALSMIQGLGPIRLTRLLQFFETPAAIWQANVKDLAMVNGIGFPLARNIDKQRKSIDIERMKEQLYLKKIDYIKLSDEQYPKILKNMYDPPAVLFYRGDISLLEGVAVAIVGSRKSTGYGRNIAERLGYELAERGIIIVSGMARGIDTYSHLGALKASGQTIAVLGSGLDIIYPPENYKLYQEILNKGLLLSEFPPGTEPHSGNFPQRNRIISGLSRGVILVEAAERSGSLITADLALEQGKELFAIPGNINRCQSKGTNNLIKNGAKLVMDSSDVLEELFLYVNTNSPDEEKYKMTYPELSVEEMQLFKLLQREGELDIEQLIEISDFKANQVNAILLKLELKGLVKREAGKKYSFLGLQNLLKPL